MIEVEETVSTVVVEVEVGEMRTGYLKIKKLLKTSSTNNSCSFKLRMEVTLRYLNRPSKRS